jgi:hypothetical protein
MNNLVGVFKSMEAAAGTRVFSTQDDHAVKIAGNLLPMIYTFYLLVTYEQGRSGSINFQEIQLPEKMNNYFRILTLLYTSFLLKRWIRL